MHEDITNELLKAGQYVESRRKELEEARAVHRGEKAMACVAQPIIDTLTKERDEALARVAELDERIKAVFDACPLERGFAMNSAAPSWYVKAHLDALTSERDEARAERDRACATRDEALAHLAELEAAQPVPAPLEWLPNTGEDPGLPLVVVRFKDGSVTAPAESSDWEWLVSDWPGEITHYLPIPALPSVAPSED